MVEEEEISRRKGLTVFEKFEIPELRQRYAEDRDWLSKQFEDSGFAREYENQLIVVCGRRVVCHGSYESTRDWLRKNPQEGIPICHVIPYEGTEFLAA